jgi:hypothetical protein
MTLIEEKASIYCHINNGIKFKKTKTKHIRVQKFQENLPKVAKVNDMQ